MIADDMIKCHLSLTIRLNIQKVILTTQLASPSVMGKPTVVATDSLIFHLIITKQMPETKVKLAYGHLITSGYYTI